MHKAGTIFLVLAIALATAPTTAATTVGDAVDPPGLLNHCDDPQGVVDRIACIVNEAIPDVAWTLESLGEDLRHGDDPIAWTAVELPPAR